MSTIRKSLRKGAIALSVSACVVAVYAARQKQEWQMPELAGQMFPQDTPPLEDTTKLPYPITGDNTQSGEGIDLKTPPALERKAALDSTLENFRVTDKVGDVTIEEKTVPYSDYMEQENRQWIQDYFKQRSQSSVTTKGGGILPELNLSTNWIDEALGGLVEVRPQGSAEVIFSQDFNRVQNPTWSLREQRNSQFKFDQKIQVGVQASIGDKINMNINYDTEASFDFENQRKLKYEGTEDEILQLAEVGDVSMPVAGSLITGSTSLFGFKTKLKFGKLDVTSVFSQQKSERKEIILDAGAQRQIFDISADNYDFNRHFFLAQYFRENYDRWQQNYPALSNIVITRVEVWVTNTSVQQQNTHTVAAFMDLGERNFYNQSGFIGPGTVANPANNSNTLFQTLTTNQAYRAEKTVSQQLDDADTLINAQDYYVLSNARQLRETDFTFDPRLGYISLNQTLNPDDVLAVAFEYTINGARYQVGEFAADVPPNQQEPNVLFLKMLKSVNVRPNLPIWDLMMKNIYSLGAYQVDPTDFRLQVVYADDRSGADLNYIPEPTEARLNGKPLIRVMQMDRFNSQIERKPDGNFDYLEGVTIVSNNGRIIFPVLEPFGSYLFNQFGNKDLAGSYIFQELYDSTKAAAQQVAQKNKFFLRGSYQGSAGAEISLNAINVQPGSVRVTANGIPLTEGSQYTVDYALGRVRITDNSVLNSGALIKVESESNTLFNIQQKTLMGTRAEYHFNKDFTLGSTILYLKERPLTDKVNVGDEPIRNAIWGVDGSYRTDSRLITRLVDRIPLIQTKELSEVAIQGEFAQIIPGHPKSLNDKIDEGDKGGVSYLDDFEGSQIPYDLRLGGNQVWTLASTPQGHPDRFPEANLVNDLAYGYKRAKLSWYTIDNSFFRKGPQTPDHWEADEQAQSHHFMREVTEQEVFPNREIPNGTIPTLQTLDLVYRPKERGPYNFTITGLDPNTGELADPKSAWAGISRRIEINDFEASNIEFLEFWLMDPFHYDSTSGGDFYINLGNISEDILRDNRKSWENGYPKSAEIKGVDSTRWGRVPSGIQITNSFDNDPDARKFQDVGYDGLTDDDERAFYDDYITQLPGTIRGRFIDDPAGDNFKYFLGDDFDRNQADVLERYKNFNNVQGNTPTSVTTTSGYGSQLPDDEDINKDFNIDKVEDYFEYRVRLEPSQMVKDKNYITDIQKVSKKLANGTSEDIIWYQFKVPIRQFSKRVGSIPDFKSIRFMRMYLTGFDTNIVLRFAQLQFLRSDWRKYLGPLGKGDIVLADDSIDASTFEVSAVNIEENGKRPDIPYVLPPGIKREQDPSTPQLIQQNEQSMSIIVCDLKKDDARAVFKNTQYDTRQYKRLKMFVHAENSGPELPDNAVSVFVRVGTDFVSNYYEYEMPLVITKHGSFDPSEIWPDANMINIELSEFYNTKQERNATTFNKLLPYTVNARNAKGRVTVIGNPDLSNIRTMMIGIRNTNGSDYPPATCVEVWVNELRVTDFDERGGWAATGRITTKLADFGRVELSGTRRTIGFGSIEQTLQQRSQQDMRSYGVITALELGKFFPQRYNVRVPMYFAYSEQINRPRYNPLSPDLPLETLAEVYKEDKTKFDSVMRAAEDFTARKSLNFTGVQKMRNPESKKKPRLYDIENFTATYIYQEVYRRNISATYDFEKLYTGRLGYNYTFNSKPWTPFSKIKNKNLKLLSDFNLYFLPQSYSMQGEINRKYAEKLYRNTDNIQTIIEPLFDKNFTLDRTYDLRYNITKALRLSYSARGQSRVEEPFGRLDTKEKRDTVKDNLMDFGKLTGFSQSAQLAYDVPINKLPFLDFITLQTSYTGNYDWQAAPPAVENLGNTIQNSQVINVNNNLNMITLYSKNKFLRNIIQGQTNKGAPKKDKPADTPKPGEAPAEEEEESKPVRKNLTFGESLVGVLLSFRSASLNYTLNNSTAIPGFRPEPQYIGQDFRTNSPGLPFIFGSQKDIREDAARNGWLTLDTNQVAPYIQSRRENIIGSGKFEPIKNLQITIDFSKQVITSFQENWRYDPASGEFEHFSPVESGNFTISYAPWRTSFKKDRDDNSNELFDVFESNRLETSRRLSEQDPFSRGQKDDTTGYYLGYGQYHQDVLIPAFLSAYTGRPSSRFSLSPFPRIPAPAWRVSYNGLSNIKAIQTFAKSVTISHGYRSTYNVDNYQTSLGYNQLPAEAGKDLVSKYRIDRIAIQERFEPLFGIDVTWANNLSTRFEMRRDRTLALSFSDRRLAEQQGKELVFGAGYRTTNFILPFIRVKRKKVMLENDLNFRLDFAIRDQKQVIRILDTDPQVTGGQRMLSFTPNISYVLTQSLTLNIFVKHTSTRPYTSNLYPTSFTSVGFSLRYVLSP